ncbi:hypothetical protein QTP88_029489 [Uroleucon formosanum]
MFDSAINQMAKDDDTIHFLNYFISYYASFVQSWAYCHRIHAGINTNMHIERMHRTLKHIYLQGKKVKRLDKSLHDLMRYIRDKLIDRLIVLHKGKISSKVKELRKRHKTSISMSLEMVLENVDGNSWNVLSRKTNEMCEVNNLKSNCGCQINCYDCQSCIHCYYSCSCIDSAIKWNMCKHIHLVCQFLKRNVENINSNNIVANFKNNIERDNETTIIVSQLNNSTKPSSQLATEKDKVRLYFNNILDRISSSQELGILKKMSSFCYTYLKCFKNTTSNVCNDPNSAIPESSQDDTEEPLKEPTIIDEKEKHGKRSRANYEKIEKVKRMNDRTAIIHVIQAQNQAILAREATDEIDLFFKSIAISVNKLPARGKTEAKLKILTLVTQHEDKYSDAAAAQSTQLMFQTPTQIISSSATSQGFEPYGTYNNQQLLL